MIAAVIPARGGSRRIPMKNIKPFCGKPIIAYSIKAALESRLFDRVIVSTDSDKIAETAVSFGAEVPFMRPAELAGHRTPVLAVVIDTLKRLAANNESTEYACCIFATAPFLTPEYLKQGFSILKKEKTASVFSVTTFPSPVYKALKIGKTGSVSLIWPEFAGIPGHELPDAYQDAGQFYWLECETFLKEKTVLTTNALPVILPRHRAQDINTPEDWKCAENMYRAINR
jgi:pseudaminic acid cytidylyltransferase